MKDLQKMYTNPVSGHIQSLENWIADYHNDDPELWPGVNCDEDISNVLIEID